MREKLRSESGATLVEVLVSMVISLLVLATLASVVLVAKQTSGDSLVRNQNISTANNTMASITNGLDDVDSIASVSEINAAFGSTDSALVALTRDRSDATWTCRAWWLTDDGDLYTKTSEPLATAADGTPSGTADGFEAVSNPEAGNWKLVAEGVDIESSRFETNSTTRGPSSVDVSIVFGAGTSAPYTATTTVNLDSGWTEGTSTTKADLICMG